MAFMPQDFSTLCYGNGFTMWFYRTPDETVTADHFAAVHPYVRVGDVIVCTVGDGTANARTGLLRVSHVESAVDRETGRTTGQVEVADLAPVLTPAAAE